MIVLIHHDLDQAALLRLDCALAPNAHHLRPDRMGVPTSFFSVANRAAGLYWPR